MTEEELFQAILSETKKWPEEKRRAFAGTLQQILADKPEEPAELEEWSDEGKKKFLKAFGITPDW